MSGTTSHATKASAYVADRKRAHWHDEALWFVRSKRDRMSQSLPEWEQLRDLAARIKTHTMGNLADYLETFEAHAKQLGVQVHWARDGAAHNRIVLEILQQHNVRRVVKSKSMLTEECHLNPFLERHNIQVVDTDLGERIVQLRNEPPSHIVLPAIHIKKEEVGELFEQHMGATPGVSDPDYLTELARNHLRENFLDADAGITGVNFAIAETGGIVICTNEGNADLGTSLPKLHIACMGVEKIIPRTADLGIFLRLLARSATGQPITTYSSHFHGPAPGGELHIVLVDNGRTRLRTSEEFRSALNCIRCGACMNTCPVYRRSGGHSYGTTVPGPIGSVLGPSQNPAAHASLPHACSLCGSCTDVCPVQIPLHHQLLAWRRELADQGLLSWPKRTGMRLTSWIMQNTWLYERLGSLARFGLRWTPRWLLYHQLNPWGKQRELPLAPQQSFRQWYQQQQK